MPEVRVKAMKRVKNGIAILNNFVNAPLMRVSKFP